MIFSFKKKKDIKSSDDLLRSLGASNVNDMELSFEFNKLLHEKDHNYVNSLFQDNTLITSGKVYRLKGYDKYTPKAYKRKKLQYLLWLKVTDEHTIENFGDRNINISLGSFQVPPQLTFNLNVKKEIANEIVSQFNKNKKIIFVCGLVKYNEEYCKMFKQNYYEGAETNNLIITRFKIY